MLVARRTNVNVLFDGAIVRDRFTDRDREFMAEALAEARSGAAEGEVPVGETVAFIGEQGEEMPAGSAPVPEPGAAPSSPGGPAGWPGPASPAGATGSSGPCRERAARRAASSSSWRSCMTSIRLRTSNGTMVAAECGIWLTTAAILSAVRSCRSRPSSGE